MAIRLRRLGMGPLGCSAALSRTDRWWEDTALAQAARAPLLRLGAEYLTAANGGRGPSDPVARFHLGNGARLERINWLGNVSPRGMKESYGLMVNYLYDLNAIEANHEAFVHNGVVARSVQVEALLTSPNPLQPDNSSAQRARPAADPRAHQHGIGLTCRSALIPLL